MSARRRLAVCVFATSLTVGTIAPVALQGATASAAAPTVRSGASTVTDSSSDGSVTAAEGKRLRIVGKVPAKYKNSLVVLEAVSGQQRQELGMAVSDKNGQVHLDVALAGSAPDARWRVVKNHRTQWTSAPFELTVTDSGKKHANVAGAATVFEHSQANNSAADFPGKSTAKKPAKATAKNPGRIASPRNGAPIQLRDSAGVANEATDGVEDAAEDVTKSTGQMVGDFAKTFASNVGWDFVADGVTTLFNVIFPGQAPATAAQIQQLTQDMNQQFAVVDQELQTIESDLNSLSAQVSTLQSEVVSANASAASASCNVLLSEANGYVSQIQDNYGNYQVALSPQWVSANLVGQNSTQALKIVGNQIYGAGSGTPSFGNGVVSLQNSVNNLANLLNANGAGATSGLVGTCASAVSSGIVAQYAANSPSTVVPIGAIEQAYYDTMHSIVAYYAGWASVGQVMSSRGGQMAAAVLAGPSVNTPSEVANLCDNTTPAAGAPIITCPGIGYYTQATINATNNAWAATGASWLDVSNGMLIGDARVDNTADFIQPAHNAWVKDIALYGQVVPGLQGPLVTTNVSADLQSPLPACYLSGGVGGYWGSCPTVTTSVTNNTLTATATVPYEMWASFAFGAYLLDSNGTQVSWSEATSPGEDTIVFSTPLSGLTNGQYTIEWQSTGCYLTATALASSNTCLIWQQAATVGITNNFADSYYSPSGALTSTSASSTTTPAAGVTALTGSSWLGVTFAPAKTSQWSWAFPYGKQTAGSALPQSSGSVMASSGLLNYGASPSNLILYTGETSTFDVNDNTTFGTPPQIADNSEFKPGSTFPDSTETAYSFLDTNAAPVPGYNLIIGAPSGSSGIVNNAQYVMSNQWTSNGGPYQSCNIGGDGIGSCSGNYSYTNYMSINNSAGAFNASATNNPTFYSPLTQNNSYSLKLDVGSDSVSSTYSNEAASVTATPSFMTNAPQQQYMWPVLPLPAGGSSAPCTLTTFTTGQDGNAGAGNVCAPMFQQWEAGALGITTGPVSLTSGSTQGTLTTSGNNIAQVLISNTASSAQTVTLYADISAGDAEVGTLINAGSSSGSQTNGVSITNCTTINAALQCTVTVQPGTTVLSIPITGAGSAANYSTGTLELGLAGAGMYSSSTTQITPTADSADVIPPAVTGFTANTDSETTATNLDAFLSFTVPAATPAVTGYIFQITDPSGNETTQTATSGSSTGVQVLNGYTAGSKATVDLNLPSTQSGLWTFEVAAVNAGGTGPYVSAQAALGNSAPATPTNFQGTENNNGSLTLTWNPVSANPALSNYAIAVTAPATGTSPAQTVNVVSNVPTYTIQNLYATGSWSFSLTAVNSVGSSDPVTTSVNVTGQVPTQPLNLDASVDGDGWVSASFNASTSVPTADTYWVGLYAPGSTTPLASIQVPVSTNSEKVRVTNFYQLASTSPTGTWTLVVTPSNSVGAGDFAESTLFVSKGLLSQIENDVATQLLLDSIPASVIGFAQDQCAALDGWHAGLNVFGTCDAKTNTFTPSTTLASLAANIGSPVGATTGTNGTAPTIVGAPAS